MAAEPWKVLTGGKVRKHPRWSADLVKFQNRQ